MKKWVCQVCGYIYEGENAPAECPVCHVGAEKFEELKGEMVWADEHRIGVAQGVDEQVVEELRANFTGECTEVGMYLAMSRQADREGYPEVAEAYKRIAFEEAEHAAKFAELLGECVVADTKENLRVRVDAEYGATDGKLKLAKKAKELGMKTLCKLRQFLKHSQPMKVSPSGNFISSKVKQLAKASFSIPLTFPLKITCFKLLQHSNAEAPIEFISFPNSTDSNCVLHSNELSLTSLTLNGITTFFISS